MILASGFSSPVIFQGGLQPVIGVFRSFGSPPPAHIAVQSAEASLGLTEKTSTIAATFLRKIFLYGDWQLLGALLLISLIFFPGAAFASPMVYLIVIFFVDILSVFVQFETGGSFRWLLDGTLLDRLVMNEMPLALFISAEIIGRHINGEPAAQLKRRSPGRHTRQNNS